MKIRKLLRLLLIFIASLAIPALGHTELPDQCPTCHEQGLTGSVELQWCSVYEDDGGRPWPYLFAKEYLMCFYVCEHLHHWARPVGLEDDDEYL